MFSHDGILICFARVLAGWWCRCCCLWRHSGHLIVHHQWKHSLCARSCSKVPIAPTGEMLMCLARLTLAQLRTLWSTTECTCRRELEKFLTPSWETHILLVVCRAAVSWSILAQWPSHRPPSVGIQLPMCAPVLKTSYGPDGKIANALALIFACATANDASVNYRGCVLQRT